MDVLGRVVLVTGGGTGLGRAIALALAKAGAHVAVNYARSRADAEAVARAVEAIGGRALAVQADVARRADVDRLVSEVEERLGPVDVLVNNAGVTRYVPFANIEAIIERDWEDILGVNVVGAFTCAQSIAQGMRTRQRGKILNVASNSAITANGSSIPYVVSKAALVALTRCLARALAPTIQVNAVAPGWMDTPWVDKYLPEDVRKRIRADASQLVDVDDVASAALHLVTNDAITGEVLLIDKGDHLG